MARRPKLPDRQITSARVAARVYPLREKYFSSTGDRNSTTDSGRPASLQEGRIAIVTNVERGMRWTLTAR